MYHKHKQTNKKTTTTLAQKEFLTDFIKLEMTSFINMKGNAIFVFNSRYLLSLAFICSCKKAPLGVCVNVRAAWQSSLIDHSHNCKASQNHKAGLSIRQIAKTIVMHLCTITRTLSAGICTFWLEPYTTTKY